MAKDYEDGVWRTIGGRRVFIKNGQSLSDAMKASGKFTSAIKKADEYYKEKTGKDINDQKVEFTEQEIEKLRNEYYDNMDKNSGMANWDGEKEVQKYADLRGTSYEEAEKDLRSHYRDYETKKQYDEYYKKIGRTQQNFQKGEMVNIEDDYTGKYGNSQYAIEREATYNEKAGFVNTSLRAYYVVDDEGHRSLHADTKLRRASSVNSPAMKKAYIEYKKKYPYSKVTLEDFKDWYK